jgi:hypothetical protein
MRFTIENPTAADLRYIASKKAKIERFRRHKARARLRAELLATDPHCWHCGTPLVEGSANLAIDRLACGDHVKIVRDLAFMDSQNCVIEESRGAA